MHLTGIRLVFVLVGISLLASLVGCQGDSKPVAAEPVGEKITLALNMKPGASKVMNMDMDMNMQIDGESADTSVGMQMTMTMSVRDVDAQGNHTMISTLDRMRVDVTLPAQPAVRIDTDDPTDKPEAAILKAMVGHPLTVKLSPQGETIEFSGLEELVDVMAAESPGSRAELETQFSGLKNQMGQMMGGLPDRPVDNGDSWTYSMGAVAGQPFSIEITATLLDRTDTEATVGLNGSMSGDVSGTITGTMYVDRKTGMTNRGEMKMNMSTAVEGQSMKMKMDAKFTSD